MKIVKFYEYYNCNTCKKALKFLTNRRYATDRIPIFTQPPSKAEIKKMIGFYGGNFLKLMMPSRRWFEELGLSEKAASLTEAQAIALLFEHPKLFRRPFVLFEGSGLVGFDEAAWERMFPE